MKLKTLKDIEEEYEEKYTYEDTVVPPSTINNEIITPYLKEINSLLDTTFKAIMQPDKMQKLIDNFPEFIEKTKVLLGNQIIPYEINHDNIRIKRELEIRNVHDTLRSMKWSLQYLFNITDEDLKV